VSQLRTLIEQARKTRRINDIFKIEPVPPQQENGQGPEALLEGLSDLETHLFQHPPGTILPADDLVRELEEIVAGL